MVAAGHRVVVKQLSLLCYRTIYACAWYLYLCVY